MVVPAGGLGAADFQSAGRELGGCTGMCEVKVEKESLRRVEEVEATVSGGGRTRQARASMTRTTLDGVERRGQPVMSSL